MYAKTDQHVLHHGYASVNNGISEKPSVTEPSTNARASIHDNVPVYATVDKSQKKNRHELNSKRSGTGEAVDGGMQHFRPSHESTVHPIDANATHIPQHIFQEPDHEQRIVSYIY